MFIVKKQITETESFRCERPQPDFQSINAKVRLGNNPELLIIPHQKFLE